MSGGQNEVSVKVSEARAPASPSEDSGDIDENLSPLMQWILWDPCFHVVSVPL